MQHTKCGKHCRGAHAGHGQPGYNDVRQRSSLLSSYLPRVHRQSVRRTIEKAIEISRGRAKWKNFSPIMKLPASLGDTVE